MIYPVSARVIVSDDRGCELLPQLFVALAFKDWSLLFDSAKLKERLEELMRLEKRRLGFDEARLVFVGMAKRALWIKRKLKYESGVERSVGDGGENSHRLAPHPAHHWRD